jgi:hypothetical protein
MSFVAAAIGGVATVGSALIGSQGQKTTQEDPEYLRRAKENLVDRADTLSHRTYDDFGGDRVAGASNNERSAFDMAASGSPQARDSLTKAGQQLDEASAMDFNEGVTSYMNPYIDSVLQPQLREQNRQYERSRTALENSKAGAWGGDRAAFSQSELERVHRESIGDLTGRTYSEAFESASRNFFNDQTRKQQAAASYQRLGEGFDRLQTSDIQNLMATGGVERLLRQANLDAQYEKYLEERDWDVNNLDTLIKAISAAGGNQTTTTTQGRSGAVGQVLGAGAALAGMYFNRKEPLEYFDLDAIDSQRINPRT